MSNEWIKWNGGECPVPKGTRVDVKYRNGLENLGVAALDFNKTGSIDMTAVSWEHHACSGDIMAWRLHEAEPTQLHERTFIPATREAFMAFFRSENFDRAGLTEDDRLEIFLNILQSGDDINENLLHELCNNYGGSLGDIPKYVPPDGPVPPEPTIEPVLSDEHKYCVLVSNGWRFSGVNSHHVEVIKSDADGTVTVGAGSYAEALNGAWEHHVLEFKNVTVELLTEEQVIERLKEFKGDVDAYSQLNAKTFEACQRVKRRYAERRGWEFLISVARNKQKNLRFVRNTEAECIQAAYKYEVLSCPNN